MAVSGFLYLGGRRFGFTGVDGAEGGDARGVRAGLVVVDAMQRLGEVRCEVWMR